jgi:hypothetical protein
MEHRLNCSSISHDGSLVVGGFSDSSVKVSSFRSKDHVFFAMLYVFFVGKISFIFTRFGICQRLVNQQKLVSSTPLVPDQFFHSFFIFSMFFFEKLSYSQCCYAKIHA